MPIGTPIKSRLNTKSDDYQQNLADMQVLWDEVAAEVDSVPTIGGQRYVDRHRRRGKMLVRERVELLVDRDTALLELSPLAGWGTQDPVGVGMFNGIGVVEGVECAIQGTDMTYRGGSANPTTFKKQARLQEIARDNRLPIIILNEAAGAELPRQADIFVPGGMGFKNLTQMSKLGIPSITVAFGPNTAGGAYTPGMSDYTVFVEGRGTAYLGGPPLVKMAIDEIVDEETLGGAEMHSTISGLSDYMAVDEMDGLRIARQIIRHLGWKKLGAGPSEPPMIPSTTRPSCWVARRPTCEFHSRSRKCLRESSTGVVSKSSSRSLATSLCVDGDRSMGSRLGYSATTASCSAKKLGKAPSSSSCATRPIRLWSFCTTSQASWSAPRPSKAASSAMAPR